MKKMDSGDSPNLRNLRNPRLPLVFLLWLLSGCDNTPYDITPVPDAPWSAAGKRAVLETFTQDGITKTRWAGGGWNNAAYESFYNSLGQGLRSSSEFNTWPKSRSNTGGVFGGPERIAPYQFYVVSLWPTVVLAIPHDYGPGRISIDPGESTNHAERMVPMKFVNNYAAVTTVLPLVREIKWYSPSESHELTRLTIPDSGAAAIDVGRAHLLIQRQGDQMTVTRK